MVTFYALVRPWGQQTIGARLDERTRSRRLELHSPTHRDLLTPNRAPCAGGVKAGRPVPEFAYGQTCPAVFRSRKQKADRALQVLRTRARPPRRQVSHRAGEATALPAERPAATTDIEVRIGARRALLRHEHAGYGELKLRSVLKWAASAPLSVAGPALFTAVDRRCARGARPCGCSARRAPSRQPRAPGTQPRAARRLPWRPMLPRLA